MPCPRLPHWHCLTCDAMVPDGMPHFCRCPVLLTHTEHAAITATQLQRQPMRWRMFWLRITDGLGDMTYGNTHGNKLDGCHLEPLAGLP